MKVREATEKDIGEWTRMRCSLWPQYLDGHEAEIRLYFEGNSKKIQNIYVLEREESKLGGFIEMSIRNCAAGCKSSPVPYLEGWYVDKDLRGRGLGALLVSYVEKWSRKNGYQEMASDANIENSQSINAHKALGFTEVERIMCFVKGLK